MKKLITFTIALFLSLFSVQAFAQTSDPYRFLSFPIKTAPFTSWNTAALTSIMDHSKYGLAATVSGNVDSNTVITAFHGEGVSGYAGSYLTNWCAYRTTSVPYFYHPVGGNIPYKGATDSTGCQGTGTMSYNGHNGFDYAVPNQTPIYASAAGVVTENQCTGAAGSCTTSVGRVIIKHTININGVQKVYYSWYMHLSKAVTATGASYAVGKAFAEGDKIGLSGATGAGSAYHLHFEVRVGGNGTSASYGAPVDPFGWYGSGPDPLSVTTGYQSIYTNEGHSNRLLWK